MSIWWVLALLSGLGLAGRNILMKTASYKTDPALAAMVLSVSMAVVSIAYLVYARASKHESIVPTGPLDWTGITMAALAGVSLASANIFLAFSYSSGGGAGLVSILQNAISISFTIAIGVLLLNEVIRPHQVFGIVLAFAGILLIVKK